MIKLTKKSIDEAMPKIKIGLYKYYFIQNTFEKTNVSNDTKFQTKFNGFYRIRRNSVWRTQYYSLFEEIRSEDLTFETIFKMLLNRTSSLEASFSSKMLATINTDMPVLDKFVLENVNLKLPYNTAQNRFKKIVSIYDQLTEHFHEFKTTEENEYLIHKFSELYPDYNISNTKMIDLILWQTR